MKRKLFYMLTLICFIGTGVKATACSPTYVSFDVYANSFTSDAYYAVEGYYTDNTTFMVVRSSDTLMVKEGKALPVFEYGPFGSMCEVYALPAHIEEGMVGENHPRVLILYKNETSNEKLVTPIFQEKGAPLKNETVELEDAQADGTKKSISKSSLYQRLFEGSKLALVWDEAIFKPFDN